MKYLAVLLLAVPAFAADKPWHVGTLTDFDEQTGLVKGAFDSNIRDKKAFTFTVTFTHVQTGVLTSVVFRKTTGGLFDTEPFVIVNTLITYQHKRGSDYIVRDHNNRNHRVRLINVIEHKTPANDKLQK